MSGAALPLLDGRPRRAVVRDVLHSIGDAARSRPNSPNLLQRLADNVAVRARQPSTALDEKAKSAKARRSA